MIDDQIQYRIAVNSLHADIYRAMLLQAGAIVGAVVAILQFHWHRVKAAS